MRIKARPAARRTHARKAARLDARLTPDTHALLRRAAALHGRSVSDFVLTAARAAAEAAISQNELLALSQADQQRFAAALLKPQPPATAMKRAASAHRKLVRRP